MLVKDKVDQQVQLEDDGLREEYMDVKELICFGVCLRVYVEG